MKNRAQKRPFPQNGAAGRSEQDPRPDLCKIYEILTIFMTKKLCLWYTVSDKRTAPLFLCATYKKEKDHEDHLHPAHPVGTLLSNLVYAVTGANYTHASLAFDEDLSCLYSSTRKNGYTMFPAAQQGIPEPGCVPSAGERALCTVCAGCER